MWRLSVVLLAVVIGAQSAPHGDENGLLQRLKRSPFCPPGPPEPPPFPPPHFGPPHPPHFGPPHPPHFGPPRHGFGFHSEAHSQALSGQYQQYPSGQGLDYQGLGGQDGPCDTCGGQSSAISNARSETGNAVAVAVSKG